MCTKSPKIILEQKNAVFPPRLLFLRQHSCILDLAFPVNEFYRDATAVGIIFSLYVTKENAKCRCICRSDVVMRMPTTRGELLLLRFRVALRYDLQVLRNGKQKNYSSVIIKTSERSFAACIPDTAPSTRFFINIMFIMQYTVVFQINNRGRETTLYPELFKYTFILFCMSPPQ